MSSQINDPQWPPSDNVDFDATMDQLLTMKRVHFPQHTARDASDPLIQVFRLIAALRQNTAYRASAALNNLTPTKSKSRASLLSVLELVARPLFPMRPSRGWVYGRLKAAPAVSTTYVDSGSRFSQTGILDPVFSVDADIATGTSVAMSTWFYDSSAGSTSAVSGAITFDDGDAIIVGLDGLAFDSVTFTQSASLTGVTVCPEYYNEEWGAADLITVQASQLYIYLDTYLHKDDVSSVNVLAGNTVTVKYKPTNTVETVAVDIDGGRPRAVTTHMGQATPSASADDYTILASWRPVPGYSESSPLFTATATLTIPITGVLSPTDRWSEHDDYGYAIRVRHTPGSGTTPGTLTFSSVANSAGDHYVIADITQGVRNTLSIGQTDGSEWQEVGLGAAPIYEPVSDPKYGLVVAGDTDWFVVDDFSNSGPTSKHAILREDPETGWAVVFGNGSIGLLPSVGSSVVLTYRTGSSNPGDLDAETNIKEVSGSGLVEAWTLPRSTSGYEPAEASDAESVVTFRNSVLPGLALRAESVVTESEIETALSGGAPNRATFETVDGRQPFSRAKYTTTGAGTRQYRVIVVGSEDTANGSVLSADLDEAEAWLNGSSVGVEIVDGHGPQNTEGLVSQFTPRELTPTITITVQDTTGVQSQIEAVIRAFCKPHAKTEDGAWRWEYGGKIPVALLFGDVWNAVSGITALTVSVNDGVSTYNLGDTISLGELELPTLSSTFVVTTNIVVS